MGWATFERALDRDERLMAVLGTQVLENQERVGGDGDGDHAAAGRRELGAGDHRDQRERVADAGHALGLLVELDGERFPRW